MFSILSGICLIKYLLDVSVVTHFIKLTAFFPKFLYLKRLNPNCLHITSSKNVSKHN